MHPFLSQGGHDRCISKKKRKTFPLLDKLYFSTWSISALYLSFRAECLRSDTQSSSQTATPPLLYFVVLTSFSLCALISMVLCTLFHILCWIILREVILPNNNSFLFTYDKGVIPLKLHKNNNSTTSPETLCVWHQPFFGLCKRLYYCPV